MSSFEDLLKVRERIKKKKPHFIRQDFKKKKKLKKKWIRPRGIHSKIRLRKAGHRKKVEVGYRSPKKVRGLHSGGLKVRVVNSFKDIKDVDKSKEGVVIAKGVGLKKKIEMIKKILENGITVFNIKDPSGYLKKKEESLEKRKEEKKAEEEKKKKEKKSKEKKGETEEKEKKEELAEKIEEEEKEKEKKEKDKLLTKRI